MVNFSDHLLFREPQNSLPSWWAPIDPTELSGYVRLGILRHTYALFSWDPFMSALICGSLGVFLLGFSFSLAGGKGKSPWNFLIYRQKWDFVDVFAIVSTLGLVHQQAFPSEISPLHEHFFLYPHVVYPLFSIIQAVTSLQIYEDFTQENPESGVSRFLGMHVCKYLGLASLGVALNLLAVGLEPTPTQHNLSWVPQGLRHWYQLDEEGVRPKEELMSMPSSVIHPFSIWIFNGLAPLALIPLLRISRGWPLVHRATAEVSTGSVELYTWCACLMGPLLVAFFSLDHFMPPIPGRLWQECQSVACLLVGLLIASFWIRQRGAGSKPLAAALPWLVLLVLIWEELLKTPLAFDGILEFPFQVAKLWVLVWTWAHFPFCGFLDLYGLNREEFMRTLSVYILPIIFIAFGICVNHGGRGRWDIDAPGSPYWIQYNVAKNPKIVTERSPFNIWWHWCLMNTFICLIALWTMELAAPLHLSKQVPVSLKFSVWNLGALLGCQFIFRVAVWPLSILLVFGSFLGILVYEVRQALHSSPSP